MKHLLADTALYHQTQDGKVLEVFENKVYPTILPFKAELGEYYIHTPTRNFPFTPEFVLKNKIDPENKKETFFPQQTFKGCNSFIKANINNSKKQEEVLDTSIELFESMKNCYGFNYILNDSNESLMTVNSYVKALKDGEDDLAKAFKKGLLNKENFGEFLYVVSGGKAELPLKYNEADYQETLTQGKLQKKFFSFAYTALCDPKDIDEAIMKLADVRKALEDKDIYARVKEEVLNALDIEEVRD